MNYITLVSAHYLQRFGEPDRDASFVAPNGTEIQIWKWSTLRSKEDVCIYATVGASEVLSSGTRRCEFFVGLQPEADDIVDALAEVAMHGNGTDEVPSFGDTLTLAYPLCQGTDMKTFLFASRGDEIIPQLTQNRGTVDFIKLIPLFPKELEVKQKGGEEELWSLFRKDFVPYWNPYRKSAL